MMTLAFALVLFLQDDPVEAAMKKILAEIAATPTINLARTQELLLLIQNEGTFLESQQKIKEQAAVYAQASEALATALEGTKAAWSRKAILALQKAAKRAEKKKDDAGRVGSYTYAFQRVSMPFQVESLELGHLVKLALQSFQSGDYDEAEDAIKEVEERTPGVLGKRPETTDENIRLAPLILTQVLLVTGRYAEGGAAVRRALALVPDVGEKELPLKDLYKDVEAYEACLRKLSEHISKNPDDLDARLLLGCQYYFTDEPAKAKAVLASIVEKKKDDEAARYFLDRLK